MSATIKYDNKEKVFCLYSNDGILLDKNRSMKALSERAYKNGISHIEIVTGK